MVRQRVRIRFSKQGALRMIGHRDLMRCMERLFRRARLPLAMSQGFHPKPRVSFPSALAVGIEAVDEVMELQLAQPRTAEDVHERLASRAIQGLEIQSVQLLPEGTRKAQVQSVRYRMPIPSARRDGLQQRIDRFLAAESWPIERAKRPAPFELRPLVEELTFCEGVLRMRLRGGPRGFARPREVLDVLELSDLELTGVHLTRTAVEIDS